MTDLIHEMNRILRQWQNTYDIFHNTHLILTVVDGSTLFLNGIAVPSFRALPLESATFGAEHILFHFAETRTLHITISWPEEGAAMVSTVLFS